MKRILILGLFVFCGYKFWQDTSAKETTALFPEEQYIAVYGRTSCGHTQRLLEQLSNTDTKVVYLDIDDTLIEDDLHNRMTQAGISTKRYNLPVVDVNGEFSIRPDVDSVLASY